MKRVHVLESYREFPDGLIGPDAERDRGWGMDEHEVVIIRDGSARYSGGCQRTLAEICSVRDR